MIKITASLVRDWQLFCYVRLAAHVSEAGASPNPPGSGKDIAEGKGVHREVESEGSWIWGTY